MMKCKNDLEMWHKFAEFAEHLKFVAEAEEQALYSQCIHYHFNRESFEEHCNCDKIERNKDFEAKNECWKCPFYTMVYTMKEKKEAKPKG